MKNTGPNSPQTIRGLLNRRSQRALLDTRTHQEADILTAPMVGPFGKGFHTLHTPAGTEYVVGDASGITFAPNAQVMVANPGGLGNRAVLGGAPANKKGGAARSRNPRRRGVPVLESNQYAFGSDGLGSMLAMLYSDGTYVSTRATETEVAGSYTGCILTDSSLLVGDGSLLLWNNGSDLKVWDVDGAAFYTYSVPSGWVNPTNLFYQNGFLYWCEFEDIPQATGSGGGSIGDPTFDYRLRKATTDLVTVSTIATVTSANASTYGPPYTAYNSPAYPFAFAVDADGAVLYMGTYVTETINHEIITWQGLQARFNIAGGAPSTRAFTIDEFRSGLDTAPPTSGGGFPCVTLGTTAFAICSESGSGHSVLSKSDDASAAAVDLWGVSDFASITPLSFSVGTGGSILQVYGAPPETIIRGIASGTEITNAVEAFDGTNYPTAMFYYGV